MASERVIWKYMIPSPDCTIDMPAGAYVVGFGHQDGQLVLWAEVDPAAEVKPRAFRIVGIGHGYESGLDHRGLVQMPNGLVWHLLEDGPRLDDLLPPAVD